LWVKLDNILNKLSCEFQVDYFNSNLLITILLYNLWCRKLLFGLENLLITLIRYYWYYTITLFWNRAVFKWLSKVLIIIMRLQLLHLVIGLKMSCKFSRLEPVTVRVIIARNFDWFIMLSAPVVIGQGK